MTTGHEQADEIVGRIREAFERGERVDVPAVLCLYPDLADEIRLRLAASRLLDRAFAAVLDANPGRGPHA